MRTTSQTKRILVGTASWSDPGFIEDWFPQWVPARNRLAWYAEHFKLVEVNSSFYAIPSEKVVANWSKQTPDDFVFDLKLHQYLSRHSTKASFLPRDLRPAGHEAAKRVPLTPKLEKDMAHRFIDAVAPLEESGKLGALLLQLSPSFSPQRHSLTELDHLLDLFDKYRVAVELRNRHWLDGEQLKKTASFFRSHQIAFVSVDGPDADNFMVMPRVDLVTTPQLAYLRAHGRNAYGFIHGRNVAERFDYDYSDKEIREIAHRALDMARLATETHMIFNNNSSDYAPRAAERFQKTISQKEKSISTKHSLAS